MQEYPKEYHLVKNIFPIKISSKLPLSWRVKRFANKLTKDPAALNVVHGYKFLS